MSSPPLSLFREKNICSPKSTRRQDRKKYCDLYLSAPRQRFSASPSKEIWTERVDVGVQEPSHQGLQLACWELATHLVCSSDQLLLWIQLSAVKIYELELTDMMIGHPRLRGAEYQLGTSTRLRHGVVPEVWWGRFWLFSFWNLFHIHEVEKGEKLSVSGQAGESHFQYLVGFGTRLVSSLQYVLTGPRCRMFLVYPKSLSSLFTFPLIPADCRCYWSKRKSDAQATDQPWLSGIHYECPFSFSSVSSDSPNCLSQDLGRKVKVTWEFFWNIIWDQNIDKANQ